MVKNNSQPNKEKTADSSVKLRYSQGLISQTRSYLTNKNKREFNVLEVQEFLDQMSQLGDLFERNMEKLELIP